MALEQNPILNTWAENTLNKVSFTEEQIGLGIEQLSAMNSNVINGMGVIMWKAIQFLQNTGGLYNAFIPYIFPNIVGLITYTNGLYALNYYLRTASNPSSTTNNPPITGASIATTNGIAIYSGGSPNSDWVKINNASISGAGAPSSPPVRVGDIYIDIDNDITYIATGTSSVSDWSKYNKESPFVEVATSETVALEGANTIRKYTNSGSITVTIPPNSSVAFPINSEMEFMAYGTGEVKIIAGSGVTITGNIFTVATSVTAGDFGNINGQYTSAIIKKVATDEWNIVGSLKPAI